MRWILVVCALAFASLSVTSAYAKGKTAKKKKRSKKYAVLAGMWTGSVESSTYGPMSGSFAVTADGSVEYSVVVQGSVWHDEARIVAWNGSSITVVVQGKSWTIPGKLDGDVFSATAPFVGAVQVTRVSSN